MRECIPARPKQSWVQKIRSVCSTDNENVRSTTTCNTVELGQKLANDPVHDAARIALVPAFGSHGVELVKEDDTRFGVSGALENSTDVGLRFANIHVQKFGSFD
jgi:hypothetical protein